MAPIAELMEVVLKSFTDRIALAVFFVSLVVLTIAKVLPSTAVGNWASEHLAFVYLAGLFSLCYLPTRAILEELSNWEVKHKLGRKRRERFTNLTAEEKRILRIYIQGDLRTWEAHPTDAAARGLSDDGILYAPNIPVNSFSTAYNIQDWARLYLKEHPRIIDIS